MGSVENSPGESFHSVLHPALPAPSSKQVFPLQATQKTRGNIKQPDFPGDPSPGHLKKLLFEPHPSRHPNIETLRAAVQIQSVGQGLCFTG